jgi:hypothetical protein
MTFITKYSIYDIFIFMCAIICGLYILEIVMTFIRMIILIAILAYMYTPNNILFHEITIYLQYLKNKLYIMEINPKFKIN